MKQSFRRSFISSAPTLPFFESRSVSAVKPEMSTNASDPWICLCRAFGVSRSHSIAIRGTYGVRRSEVETPACADLGGAVATGIVSKSTIDGAVTINGVKGVILAGGSGTRLHPLTRITNKHLLPIYDRPLVTYAIEALVDAGVNQLMLVTGGTHAGEFFRLLGNGHEYGIDKLFYGYQEKPGGIAEALGLAERFVDRDPCVVMLADNVLERSIGHVVEKFRGQQFGARVVLARESDPEHLRHLGVPELDGDGRIVRIVEKPEEPPSEYAVTGIYFYDSAVWEMLPTLEPSGAASSRSPTSTTGTSSRTRWSTTCSRASGATPEVDRRVLRGQRLVRAEERTSERPAEPLRATTTTGLVHGALRASELPEPVLQSNLASPGRA